MSTITITDMYGGVTEHEPLDPMAYEETVKVVRAADESIGDAKWEIGDAVLAVAPMGEDSANNGSWFVIQRLAADTGIEDSRLNQYRKVSAAFPPGTRVPGISWTIHRMFMSKPDHLEALISTAEEQEDYTGPGDITVSWAQDFIHDVRQAEWAEKAAKAKLPEPGPPKVPKMPTERPEHIEVTAYVQRADQVPEGVRISKIMSVWNYLDPDRFAGVVERLDEVAASLNDQERSELLRRLDLVEQQVKARFARMRKDLTPQVPRVR